MSQQPDLRGWERAMVPRARPFAVQEQDGSYRWVWQKLTKEHLADHLEGRHTIAVSSLDAAGRCRWVCLDADAQDGLQRLAAIRQGLLDLGFTGILEASRRGGHLWLLFAELVPAALARSAVQGALQRVYAQGIPATQLELYPDTDRPGALGHAVRLPLGIHQRSGKRYPLLGSDDRPLTFTSPAAGVTWLLAQQRISTQWLRASWKLAPQSVDRPPPKPSATRSRVIRWVDDRVDPRALLDQLAPGSSVRPVGEGFLAWCPFHPDIEPQEDGSPGTPSFYLVHNDQYGWSWRCLSTNCPYHEGPMKHTFRLFCLLLSCDERAGIEEARHWWPASQARSSKEE